MDDGKPTTISWSNNEGFLRRFHENYISTDQLLKDCRDNIALLPKAFDHAHAVWRMEKPYLNQKGKLEKQHEELRKRIDSFRTLTDPELRQMSFKRIYNLLDDFFSELTAQAIKTGFYPKKIKARGIDDQVRALENR